MSYDLKAVIMRICSSRQTATSNRSNSVNEVRAENPLTCRIRPAARETVAILNPSSSARIEGKKGA